MATQKKAIAVTGTPGAGKTYFAKQLCSSHPEYEYLDLNAYLKEKELYEQYDDKDETFIVDEKRLTEIVRPLIEHSQKTVVIDSHLSHYIDPALISLCYVVRCPLAALHDRLKQRSYSEKKIRDNLDSEIFQICLNEADEMGHTIESIESC
jgi:adenylate kinase